MDKGQKKQLKLQLVRINHILSAAYVGVVKKSLEQPREASQFVESFSSRLKTVCVPEGPVLKLLAVHPL